jgi:hypothetical protein
MIRTLLTAGAVAFAMALSSGLALADANSGQEAPPPAKPAPALYPGYVPPWHYELQYTYGHHGEWTQQWVPVMNNAR